MRLNSSRKRVLYFVSNTRGERLEIGKAFRIAAFDFELLQWRDVTEDDYRTQYSSHWIAHGRCSADHGSACRRVGSKWGAWQLDVWLCTRDTVAYSADQWAAQANRQSIAGVATDDR
jgi:hypothetical protein